MSDPTAPVFLPPLTFLMSDHNTASLAVEVAELLSSHNGTLYVDDFLFPVYEGLQSMFDMDWKRDMGNPGESNRLMLEALDGESSERDVLVSLEKWFNETFGETQLGKMGHKRMTTNRELFSYPYLFRDATPLHIQPFVADTSIPRRDMLIVWLAPHNPSSPQPFEIPMLIPTSLTPEGVVKSIEGAAR